MSWIDNAFASASTTLNDWLPDFSPIDSARGFISEQVAQRIRDEASARAYELLAKKHRETLFTVVWQNLLLLASLPVVYALHAPWPFYAAYAVVAGYSMYTVVLAWPLVQRLLRTRSITQTLSYEVLHAIKAELEQREVYEQKAVEWLGPDLKTIADDVAKKLRPDAIAMCANLGATLVLAFVAFRLFAIPLLEQRALLGHF